MELLKKSKDKEEEEDDDAERVLAEAAAATAESKRTDMFMMTEDNRLNRRDAESPQVKAAAENYSHSGGQVFRFLSSLSPLYLLYKERGNKLEGV